jgi:peroxiredoxin
MTLIDKQAPDFEFESTSGDAVRLSATLNDGPTVVVAFRGTWCSYCAEQLQTFSQLEYDMWRHLDLDVLSVSGVPDSGAPGDAGPILPLDAVAV